jgi:hypothetical protein
VNTKLKAPSEKELQHERALFAAFCDRCNRNPLDWSVQTRRAYRKQVQQCRKHDRMGGAL